MVISLQLIKINEKKEKKKKKICLPVQETQEIQVRSLAWKDPLEESMANPLQYSGLDNAMDREA